ncbi:endoribonuclease L-PSP domain-containing protein [Heterostelium album PN500]|uniref:Diphthine--ammonia ligase n=1 Tax=Heterostelium pallidum (strain ATCC 26659 / Pp 5 / PN500) TaxID=670386 RepID=D3BUH6_HETP5|nr:endoribonuclease L-PSP domain-containing protein [Heterostelium album PN500]EFA74764.1 endoribonuclease L-PSP domain-containing protein [Heterostelium album PN500]|eukprot:XP_020426898.1 endoribonuclease L-PSP domain-containing protein [Heterostelium album PN500]
MRLVGLISGGKDSIYNLLECVRNGHTIVALAHLVPPVSDHEEIDSYMYQTVGFNVIEAIADALQLPLTQRTIVGKPKSQDEIYRITDNDEVEDLYQLLADVKSKHPDVQGVASGAILSTYQRIRVENVSSRLGLTSYCYLWKRDQDELLGDMIESKMNAILIKVASMGLEPKKHLLKTIEELYPALRKLNQLYGVNICGEGGEYESLVLDCPLFKKRIQLDETNMKIHADDAFAQVAFISIVKFSLVEKSPEELEEQKQYLLPLNDATSLRNRWSYLFAEIDTTSTKDLLPYVPSSATCKLQEDSNTTAGSGSSENVYNTLQLIESKSTGFFVIPSYSPVSSSELPKSPSNPAARACLQTTLPKGQSVMFDIIGCRQPKKNLHVQSISNWAPACIGPYSQATFVNGLVFMAGQIGLIPGTLTMVPSGVESELQQILVNLVSVFDSVPSSLENTLHVTIFLKDIKHSNLVSHYLKQVFKRNKVMPLFLMVEAEAMPRDAHIELLLLNEMKPGDDDEEEQQQNQLNHFTTDKHFHDTQRGILTGYNSLVTTSVGHSTLLNFFLSLEDLNHQDNLFTPQFLADYYCSSLSDVLISTISKMRPSNIIYLKIYHISSLSSIQKDIKDKLCKSLGNIPISFVMVNRLYVEENPHNIIINTEIMVSNK